jgi:hypothetical protein
LEQAGTASTDAVCGNGIRQFGGASYDVPDALAIDPDGALYVLGYTASSHFLQKIAGDGTLLWTTEAFGFGTQLAAGAGPYFYVDASQVSADSGAIFKIDKTDGAIVDTIEIREYGSVTNIHAGADGSVYVSAVYSAPSGDGWRSSVSKYDADGTVLWNEEMPAVVSSRIWAVTDDAAGNVYASGYSDGVLADPAAPYAQYLFLVKYDAAGHVVWTKQNATTTDETSEVLGIAMADNGNVCVLADLGATQYGTPSIRTFAPGDAVGTFAVDYGYGVSSVNAFTVENGRIITVGEASDDLAEEPNAGGLDAVARTYGLDGTVLSTTQLGTVGDDGLRSVARGPDGTLFVAGYTSGALQGTNAGATDAFVMPLLPSP